MKTKTLLKKSEKEMRKIDFSGSSNSGKMTPVDYLGIAAIILSVMLVGLVIFLR